MMLTKFCFLVVACCQCVSGSRPINKAAFVSSSTSLSSNQLRPNKDGFIMTEPTEMITEKFSTFQLRTNLNMLPDLPTSIMMEGGSTTLMTAVEVFDGSTIVDPVIVSNVFWGSLISKMVSVIIGQFIAAGVFAFVASTMSSKLPELGEFVASKIFQQQPTRPTETRTENNNNYQNINDRNNLKWVPKRNPSSNDPTNSDSTMMNKTVVTPDFSKLLLCIIIDVIGTSSELLPILGELTDVAWAPIAALALKQLFNGSNVVFALEFAEEFLPFTDIIPLATLCWVIETFYADSDIAKGLGIGDISSPSSQSQPTPPSNKDSFIDVDVKK